MRWWLAVVLWWCVPAHADRWVVGVEDLRYLPYYDYHDGQYGGMARDVLDAFAADSGHQFEYRAFPIKRLYVEFLAGQLDFKFPDNPDWAGKDKTGKTIFYSAPVMPFVDGVLVLPARRGGGLDQLKILGTVQGFTAFDYLDAIAAKRLRLREISSLEALIQASLHRRVDGSYFNVVVAERYLHTRMNLPGALVFDPALPHTRSHYHLSSLRHAAVIREFDHFLRNNQALLTSLRKKGQIPNDSAMHTLLTRLMTVRMRSDSPRNTGVATGSPS